MNMLRAGYEDTFASMQRPLGVCTPANILLVSTPSLCGAVTTLSLWLPGFMFLGQEAIWRSSCSFPSTLEVTQFTLLLEGLPFPRIPWPHHSGMEQRLPMGSGGCGLLTQPIRPRLYVFEQVPEAQPVGRDVLVSEPAQLQ